MIIIKNAKLYNMVDIEGETKDILVEGKTIKGIGLFNPFDYPNATVINAKNHFTMPGIVDPHCHIGLWESTIGWAGSDGNEVTNPITPELKGIDSVKPHDEAFSGAIRGGVTTVVTGPGSANVIGGTFCALKTYGKTVEDMVIVPEIAMKMALGENPKRVYGTKNQYPSTRMASAAIMRDALTHARDYKEKMDDYNKKKAQGLDCSKPEYNNKWASLSRVFEGMRVKIHAHQADDIMTAIRISKEFGLNSTIEHCTEGHLIVDELKKYDKQVIIGPVFGDKSKYELKCKSFDGAKVLKDKGITFGLMTDHPVIPLENTLTQAAIFVKHGLSKIDVLKAMTINSAKVVGLDNIVGSIEVGKDADIVIYSKDPLHYESITEYVIINGNLVYKA